MFKLVNTGNNAMKNLKTKIQKRLFDPKEEHSQLSTLHFYGMSFASVLSTCIYLYFIMNLLVLLFFRDTPLEIFTKIEKDDDDNESVVDLEVPIPALYVL